MKAQALSPTPQPTLLSRLTYLGNWVGKHAQSLYTGLSWAIHQFFKGNLYKLVNIHIYAVHEMPIQGPGPQIMLNPIALIKSQNQMVWHILMYLNNLTSCESQPKHYKRFATLMKICIPNIYPNINEPT